MRAWSLLAVAIGAGALVVWGACGGNEPATLALITAVGPPDWATRQFPTSSAMAWEDERVQNHVKRSNQRLRSEAWQIKFPTIIFVPRSPVAGSGRLSLKKSCFQTAGIVHARARPAKNPPKEIP